MDVNQAPTIVRNTDEVNCKTRKKKRLKIRRLVENSGELNTEKSETNSRLGKVKRVLITTLLLSVASAVLLGHHLTQNNAAQSSIVEDFVSSYRRHYFQIIHGKPHYCDTELDVQNLILRIQNQILNQEEAIRKLDLIFRNETQLRSIAIVGPSGVGKTMTASVLMSNFQWRENMWAYAWNTHVKNEVEKFRILRMYVDQFTDCGRNLLIVDNLSPCDNEVITLLNQMISMQHEHKKHAIVIYIFNLNSMLSSDLYQKQRNSLQNLPNTTTVNFKSFNEKELKDCIRREVQTEDLILSDVDFEEIVATIDVATSGCRGRNVFESRDAVIYLFKTFRFVGLNPPPQCRFLYFFYGSIITLFVVLLSPLIFNFGWIRDRNVLSIMEILNCVQAALNVIGVPIKSITLALSLDRLRSVNPLLMKLDARYTNPEDVAKIRSCAITGNRIVFGYIISYLMYETLTVLSALLGGHAPLTLWIPYVDWHRSTWEYWLQVSFDSAMLFFILFHQILNDSYPAVYIYIIRTQVQLLANRVRRLGLGGRNRGDTYQELQDCIITHQEILSLVSVVEPVISATMFVQFFIAAVILGTTMINIFIFADFTSRIAAVTYLFCVLLQTSPTCYYASHLQSDCEKLSMSIFHSNWLAQDKHFNQMLIYFLHRSQADIPFFALKLVPINLSTSISIAKFSFTLYTFIQKMGIGKNLKQ